MEPHGSAEPIDLRSLRIDVLQQAVDLYMALAYPTGSPPEAVRRRLDWAPGVDPATLLTRPPFEQVKGIEDGTPAIFALRLGNTRYPHMKLQIQPWPNPVGFLLSVNTHDQVLAIDPNAHDAPAFRALQAENQALKEAIEVAWDRAELPTFLQYLRQYLSARAGNPPTPPKI